MLGAAQFFHRTLGSAVERTLDVVSLCFLSKQHQGQLSSLVVRVHKCCLLDLRRSNDVPLHSVFIISRVFINFFLNEVFINIILFAESSSIWFCKLTRDPGYNLRSPAVFNFAPSAGREPPHALMMLQLRPPQAVSGTAPCCENIPLSDELRRRRPNTTQHSAAQHNTAQHSAAQRDAA